MKLKPHLNASRGLILGLSILAAAAYAGFPLGDMGPRTLGLQYGLALRGQDITEADVPSHETIHALSLAYAPIPYLALEAGLGLDKLTVDRKNAIGFRGEYGLAPIFGLTLASPYLADLVRAVGGARFLYLRSEDERGFAYSGLVSNPFLGVLVSPSGYFDAEAGARLHFLNGVMRGPSGPDRDFGNRETVRGYFAFTLKSPTERAFLTLDGDFSPALDQDWGHGPREAAIGISFGTLLGWKAKSDRTVDSSAYFPDFPSMRERLRKMAEEIE